MSAMPRSVAFRPPREAPPDWWGEEFYRRQGDLRARIPELLARCERPMTLTEIGQRITARATIEIAHALAALVAAGAIAGERRTERRNPRHPASELVERVYYSLPPMEDPC